MASVALSLALRGDGPLAAFIILHHRGVVLDNSVRSPCHRNGRARRDVSHIFDRCDVYPDRERWPPFRRLGCGTLHDELARASRSLIVRAARE